MKKKHECYLESKENSTWESRQVCSEGAISDEDALKILKTIADNSGTGPCHRDRMDGEISVDTILDDLVKRDVVECDRGQYYRIRVGLFNEWLIVNG